MVPVPSDWLLANLGQTDNLELGKKMGSFIRRNLQKPHPVPITRSIQRDEHQYVANPYNCLEEPVTCKNLIWRGVGINTHFYWTIEAISGILVPEMFGIILKGKGSLLFYRPLTMNHWGCRIFSWLWRLYRIWLLFGSLPRWWKQWKPYWV